MSATVTRLEPELTIYNAGQVRDSLLAALSVGSGVVLELDDVCELDSAGIQLLLAAVRHASDQGVPLELRGHSECVREAFALMGLDLQCNGVQGETS